MENSRSRARYSDLPRELLSLIGKRLDTSVDVLRFRSVCRSWRASIRKSNVVSLLSRLRFPSPYRNGDIRRRNDVFLIRRIIYRFSPLRTWPSSSSTPATWLAKVESTKFGEIRFRDQISLGYIERLKVLEYPLEANWLDLRFHEVARSYSLECLTIGSEVYGVTKVVLSPDSVWSDRSTCTIVAIHSEGKLGFAKHRGENWTLIDDQNFDYDDLIVYKGQIYTVNRRGTVSWIDSSMKLIQFSHKLPSGNQKHLVECGGELYAAEGLTGDFLRDPHSNASEFGFEVFCRVPHSDVIAPPSSSGIDFDYFLGNVTDPSSSEIGSDDLCRDSPHMKVLAPSSSIINFNVYRLIQKQGRWEEVRDLGDHAFLLGKDCCFSVSAPKSVGLEANCIYFETKFHILDRNYAYSNTYAFNLKERRIYEDNMVRSTPIWLC